MRIPALMPILRTPSPQICTVSKECLLPHSYSTSIPPSYTLQNNALKPPPLIGSSTLRRMVAPSQSHSNIKECTIVSGSLIWLSWHSWILLFLLFRHESAMVRHKYHITSGVDTPIRCSNILPLPTYFSPVGCTFNATLLSMHDARSGSFLGILAIRFPCPSVRDSSYNHQLVVS